MTERASIKKIQRGLIPILLVGCMAVGVACSEDATNEVTEDNTSAAETSEVSDAVTAENVVEMDLGLGGITLCYDTTVWYPVDLKSLEAFHDADPAGTAILTDKLDRGLLHTASYSAIHYPGLSAEELQAKVVNKMSDIHNKLISLDEQFYGHTLTIDSFAMVLNDFQVTISSYEHPLQAEGNATVFSCIGARPIGDEHLILLSLESQVWDPKQVAAEFERLSECLRIVDRSFP